MPERILSSSDVAQLLGVQPQSVSNWRKRANGRLPEPTYQTANGPAWTSAQMEPVARATREALAERLRRMEVAARILIDQTEEVAADAAR